LKWLLGAYYLDLTGSYPPFVETGPALGGLSVDIASTITTRSYAGFGQFDYEILPRLTLTLGGRYTADEVSGDGSEYTTTASGSLYKILVPQSSARSTFDKFTYKAALNYAIDDDLNLYASTSTGFKAGTYPSIPFSTTVVPPETLTAYEVGLRSEWLDRRLRLNLTAFYEAVDNYQVQVVQQNTTTGAFSLAIASAPHVHSEGLEANGQAAVTRALSLDFALTLQQAKYDTYENAPFYTTLSPYGAGYVLTSASADGKYLARAPEVALNIGGTYKLDTPVGPVRLNANWKHTSTYYWDPDNFHSQGPVDLVDASIKYVNPDPDARWSIEIWAKNLLNQKYYWGENEAAGGTPGVVAPPLTFGFTLGYKL
jgi:iron complex outermembrane receptor protein